LTSGTNVISLLSKTSGRAAYIDYYVMSGNTMRAGTVIATWNSLDNVVYTDYSTQDLDSSTASILLSVDISGSDIRLLVTITSGTWDIKSSIKII
jgi:hypothetical protein